MSEDPLFPRRAFVASHVVRGDLFLLAALALACSLMTPIWRPLLDEDEPRYVAAAEHMIESGDYIVPRFNGQPRHQKPVLIYWLMAASMALVGEEAMGGWEWPARLPSGLAATAICLLLYRLLVRRQSRRAAWLAAVGFLAFPPVAIWARAASTDMVLALLLAATILCGWWAGESRGRRRQWLYMVAAAGAGLGFLTKGPVGAALPIVVLCVHWGFSGVLRERLAGVPWARASLVFATLGLGWYVAVSIVESPDFLRPFFLRENLGRIVTGAGGPKESLDWSRLIVPTLAVVGFLPYSPFGIAGLFQRPSRSDERHRSVRHLLHTWFWATLIVFALPKGQWPSYALPLAAPMALIAASELDQRLQRPREGLGAWTAVTLLSLVWIVALTLGPSIAQQTPPEYSHGLPVRLIRLLCTVSAGLLAVGTAAATMLRVREARVAAASTLLATWILAMGVFVQVTAPLLVQHVTGPKVSVGHAIAARCVAQPVLTYGNRYSSLPFYAGRPLEFFTQDDPGFTRRVEALRAEGSVWVVADPKGAEDLSRMWPVEVVEDADRLLLVRVAPRDRVSPLEESRSTG